MYIELVDTYKMEIIQCFKDVLSIAMIAQDSKILEWLSRKPNTSFKDMDLPMQ